MAKVKKAQMGAIARALFKGVTKAVPKATKAATPIVKKTAPKAVTPIERDIKAAFSNIERAELKKKLQDIDKKMSKKRAGGKLTTAKGGKQMLKRADGSVSQRGLWDNIRAAAKRNKAAGKPGKKPTAAMLKQERKIKAKGK